VNKLRYLDWAMTTPLMLVSLSLVLSMNSGIKFYTERIVAIVILDFFMLYSGYLGETGRLDRMSANVLGFLPFIGIFGILYVTYVKGRNNWLNKALFGAYLFIWSLYGVAYLFDEDTMNMSYNILDCIAKAFIAMGLSAHFVMK
jgi:bacteriorhodopsin